MAQYSPTFLPGVRVDEEKMRATLDALREFGMDVSPGVGDVLASQRATERYGEAAGSFGEGEYLQAASQGAEGLAEHLTTLPLVGDVAMLGKMAGMGLAGALRGAPRATEELVTEVADPTVAALRQPEETLESFHAGLLEKPTGDRATAMAKMKAGEELTEPEVNALSVGMKKRYVEGRAAETESGLTHEDLLSVPDVPQTPVERYQPPRGVNEQTAKLAKNDKAYAQIREWAEKGNTEEGIGWYNTEELRKTFVEELGEKAGNDRFDRFVDLVASTSAGARVPDNIRIASYYDILAEKGLPAVKPPKGSGYGHKAQALHQRSAQQLAEGGKAVDPLQNPKRYSFAQNLRGNFAPTTVDKHNVRAWGIASKDPRWLGTKLEDTLGGAPKFWNEKRYGKWNAKTFSPQKFMAENPRFKWDKLPPTWFKGVPSKTEYAALEKMNERLAADMGVSPAQAQAALWLGAGERTGLGSPPAAFARVFDDVLKKRGAERGQAPKDVLVDFLRGKRPLQVGGTGLGAGTLAYGATRDDDYEM